MATTLTKEKILKYSGLNITQGKLDVLKQKNFIHLSDTAGGDAPKDIIKVYEYGRSIKENKKTWIKYIAKVGHKWYPNESITEHYLTKVGQCFGISVANSRIVFIENYIRFLSEHFHSNNYSLEHGANILSRYISESSNTWIDELDNNKTLKKDINISDILHALKDVFEDDFGHISHGLVDMILFDSLTGNNDRHYYNWGVIRHISGDKRPYFSPIYDTARGLFWNKSDKKIVDLYQKLEKGNTKQIENYVLGSKPKISIPDNSSCNHFDLVAYLKKNNYITKRHIERWSDKYKLNCALNILKNEFNDLFIIERISIIEFILKSRFEKLSKLLKTNDKITKKHYKS